MSNIHTITDSASTPMTQDRSSIAAHMTESIAKYIFSALDDIMGNLVLRLESADLRDLQKEGGLSKPPPLNLGHSASQFRAPAFDVPYSRNPDFVGRFSALSQLFGMWEAGSKGRIAVAGLGGIGKTELVVEFVYRVRQISPTTPIHWFCSGNFQTPSERSEDSPIQMDEWLSGSHGADSLLVVDPSDKIEELLEVDSDGTTLIDKLQNFEGTVILLTRNVQDGYRIAGPRGVCDLEDLELEAATSLLRDSLGTIAHDSTSEDEVTEVVTLLACLPRAINQVAAVINNTGMKVSQFLDLYRQGDKIKLQLLGKIDTVSPPDPSASIVGQGVFDIKEFRKAFPGPARILYQLYFFGGASVPRTIFSFVDKLDLIVITYVLHGHYLVVEDSKNQTFTIHPLVYLAMKSHIEDPESETDEAAVGEQRAWFEEVTLSFCQHYPDASVDDRAWWKDFFDQVIARSDLSNEKVRISVATVYHRESTFFKRKGIYPEALKMASLARSTLPNPMAPDFSNIVQNEIALFCLLAKYRDVQETLQCYASTEEYTAPEWTKRIQAKLDQAECTNHYNSAVDVFQEIRSARETSNGPKADLLLAWQDVGEILMFKGKYQEAADSCSKALLGRTTTLGNSHLATLTSFHSLADILKRQGKFDKALQCIEEAIRGRDQLLGSDHPETLHSKAVKAAILYSKAISLSNYKEAEALLLSVIDQLSVRLSPTHPLVLSCKSEMALIVLSLGMYDQAEQINKSVLEARTLGPWLEPASHPDTLTSKYQLAEVLRLKSGFEAVDQLTERNLVERTEILANGTAEDFHPDQLSSLQHRAIVLSGLGQSVSALQKIELALSARKAVLGPNHPDVYSSLTWKGEIMRLQLPRYESERLQLLDVIDGLHKQALQGLTWIFGPDHQFSLQCMTNMALAKFERGESHHAEAEDLYRRVFKSYQRNLGDLHPETLKSKGRLAEAMRALDPENQEEAKRMWRESCAGFSKLYGAEAEVTSRAYKAYEKFLRTYPDP